MNKSSFELEICTAAIQSVLAADRAGARRVELCDNLYEGGTTPSLGLLLQAKEQSQIDVFPIIRLRGGDFYYTDTEIEIMKKDIRLFREHGADGVVVGCLTKQGTIDYDNTARLIDAAKDLPITFHRAFDMCAEPYQALETLKKLSVQRLLTSGGSNTAEEGKQVLKELVIQAGNQLKIMVGSGINENNIEEMAHFTQAKAFHCSLRSEVESAMKFRREGVYMGGLKAIPEFSNKFSDEKRIRQCVSILQKQESCS